MNGQMIGGELFFIQNGQDVLDVEGATNVDRANIISYAKTTVGIKSGPWNLWDTSVGRPPIS